MARKTPDMMAMMRQLIETASISSVQPALDMPNLPVIDLLATWLEDLGFRVEVLPVPDAPGKANLLARIGPGSGGLVLAGHTDTVPCDEHLWRHNPFRLTEADGRLYGLGTADMKAFLAIAIEAARRAGEASLAAPLTILATADEESSMCGAKALLDRGASPGEFAIIGEPTGLQPVRMHKGIMMDAIAIHGRSGHSSDPSLGANAMEAAYTVIGELLAWREEIRQRDSNDAFAVPYATLNLGYIHGGDNPNRICGDCEIHIDLRPLPGMETDGLREELQARVRSALREHNKMNSTTTVF
jgi:acetylornithine deacetylase